MPVIHTEYHIDVSENNSDPVALLSAESGLSKQKIKQAMQKGAVWLTDSRGTQRLRRQSKKVDKENSLHLYYDEAVLNNKVDDAVLVADEGDYSVWYKPRGMMSQGSKWGDHGSISRWVEKNLQPQRPAFIVHRLDRYASGLILIAHKKKVAAMLSDLFQKKKITKQYKVIVHGLFPDEVMTCTAAIDGKPAISHVSLLQYDEVRNISLLKVNIETGRKHQIRLHLSQAGFPVVGDKSYGIDKENNNIDLQLTAFKLSFTYPVDGEVKNYVLAEQYQPQINSLNLK